MFFATWILAIALLISIAIIVVAKHLSYCCCYDCFGNKLRKMYARKMLATKMSYLRACSWCTTSLNAPSCKVNITYIFMGNGWSMTHNNMSTWLITFTLLVFPFSLHPTSNPLKAKWTKHENIF
jgi:hypothetical protein